jgi:succinate-acetate transporter protein
VSDLEEPPRLVEKHESWTRAGPVLSHLPEHEIVARRERAIATIAAPGTVGFWSFATGTWMSATVLGGFLGPQYGVSAAPTVVFFAGITQFIAGLFAFRRTDALCATAFTCFGAFNTAAGTMLLLEAVGAVSAQTGSHEMLGFLLESFAFISLALALGSLRHNLILVGLLAMLCLGYCLTGIGQFLLAGGAAAHGATLGTIAAAGGACLLASAFLAYYLGLALLVNSTWNRGAFPIFGEP